MITIPDMTSARAPRSSLASVLPIAATPSTKITVINNFETTRVAVASIQPRRQRRAASQPPPAPANTARVTMTRMPTLRTIITHQYRTAPMAAPMAAKTATSQPIPARPGIWFTLTMRRTADSIDRCAALNRPSDNASTTSIATVVNAMALKAKSTPEAVPVNAWVNAWPSRFIAARMSWAQKVATRMIKPIGKIIS